MEIRKNIATVNKELSSIADFSTQLRVGLREVSNAIAQLNTSTDNINMLKTKPF